MRVSLVGGKIQRIAQKKGKPMPAIDSLIAATGIAHDLTVVTRQCIRYGAERHETF